MENTLIDMSALEVNTEHDMMIYEDYNCQEYMFRN